VRGVVFRDLFASKTQQPRIKLGFKDKGANKKFQEI
jgi:hypothetical protein